MRTIVLPVISLWNMTRSSHKTWCCGENWIPVRRLWFLLYWVLSDWDMKGLFRGTFWWRFVWVSLELALFCSLIVGFQRTVMAGLLSNSTMPIIFHLLIVWDLLFIEALRSGTTIWQLQQSQKLTLSIAICVWLYLWEVRNPWVLYVYWFQTVTVTWLYNFRLLTLVPRIHFESTDAVMTWDGEYGSPLT